MTILEKMCIKIEKEKEKKATATTNPPPSYHCNISYVGEQGPVLFEARRRGGREKGATHFRLLKAITRVRDMKNSS